LFDEQRPIPQSESELQYPHEFDEQRPLPLQSESELQYPQRFDEQRPCLQSESELQ
jgi:hypothetical protein